MGIRWFGIGNETASGSLATDTRRPENLEPCSARSCQDIGAIALLPAVSEMYRIRRPNGETLSEYLHRVTVEAISRYPILAHPTRLDLGEARIVALDLDEVAGRGGATPDKQTGVMYMLARHAAAACFFQMPEHLNDAPVQNRDYHAKWRDPSRPEEAPIRRDTSYRAQRQRSATGSQLTWRRRKGNRGSGTFT